MTTDSTTAPPPAKRQRTTRQMKPPQRAQFKPPPSLPKIKGWMDTDKYRPTGRQGPDKLQHVAVAHVMSRAWLHVIWKWNKDCSSRFGTVCSAAMTREDAKKAMINACIRDEGESFTYFAIQEEEDGVLVGPEVEGLAEVRKCGCGRREGDMVKMTWDQKIHFIQEHLHGCFETDGNLIIRHPDWRFKISEIQMYSDASNQD